MAAPYQVELVSVGATPILPAEEPLGGLTDGIALCLSGGGFRAMLYHAGALIRLNEFGLLGRISRVSSVSGGSITAGQLAFAWKELAWTDDMVRIRSESLDSLVVGPLRVCEAKRRRLSRLSACDRIFAFQTSANSRASFYSRRVLKGDT
jgi:NTE family protein